MTAALIVSVSLTGAETPSWYPWFAAQLDARLVPVSWLLPPRPHKGRHRPDAPLIGWLRERTRVGDALVLHGFDHTVTPGARRWPPRRAEFAGLPSHEATLRLIAATRTMDHLGLPSDVFAPPRWLASDGTVRALRRRGFRVCADGAGVRLLDQPGELGRLVRGRVLSLAGMPAGTTEPNTDYSTEQHAEHSVVWRQRSLSAALVRAAGRAARRGGLVRIAVTTEELTHSASRAAVLAAVDAALAAGARPATYRLPVPDPAAMPA